VQIGWREIEKIPDHTGGALLRSAPVSAQCELSASCLNLLMIKGVKLPRQKSGSRFSSAELKNLTWRVTT
jgi:hypothetical protein